MTPKPAIPSMVAHGHPKNYGGQSHGSVPLLTALAKSYNQAAVNVGMQLGLDAFKAQLGNLSITTDIPPYPSAMLGAIDLSPMQMLGMYQIFANGGAYTPIHTIRTVIDDNGRVLQRSQPRHQFRAPPQAVYLLNRGLQEVIKSGTAKAADSINNHLGLAGKTGTTNDNRDAWFAGYSGNYVSVVWVGRDDNQPIGLTGGFWCIAHLDGLYETPEFNGGQSAPTYWRDLAVDGWQIGIADHGELP